MLKMTHFWTISETRNARNPAGKWVILGPKSDPKWVISGSLARARARARGDKIDFVLEMPFWGFKMDYPKMTHFGSLFGPQIIGNRLMFWSKK